MACAPRSNVHASGNLRRTYSDSLSVRSQRLQTHAIVRDFDRSAQTQSVRRDASATAFDKVNTWNVNSSQPPASQPDTNQSVGPTVTTRYSRFRNQHFLSPIQRNRSVFKQIASYWNKTPTKLNLTCSVTGTRASYSPSRTPRSCQHPDTQKPSMTVTSQSHQRVARRSSRRCLFHEVIFLFSIKFF